MKISILLSTYNGEKYLREQLNSLKEQTYQDFEIFARDDGSCDESVAILLSYGIKIIPSEKNIGASDSFGTLLEYAVLDTQSEYFMFCDQDDIWDKDKIEISVKKIEQIKRKYGDIPLLVHSDLQVVDEDMNVVGKSFWNYENINPKYNSFNKLLMQNTITGCTMIINRKLARLSLPIDSNVIMHDWWIGLVGSCFGKIEFLSQPTMRYRQHNNNEIGAKMFTLGYLLKKGVLIFIDKEFQNMFQKNILQAKIFLECYRDKLDDQTIDMLEKFSQIEGKGFFQKRKICFQYGLMKQGFFRNIGLFLKL